MTNATEYRSSSNLSITQAPNFQIKAPHPTFLTSKSEARSVTLSFIALVFLKYLAARIWQLNFYFLTLFHIGLEEHRLLRSFSKSPHSSTHLALPRQQLVGRVFVQAEVVRQDRGRGFIWQLLWLQRRLLNLCHLDLLQGIGLSYSRLKKHFIVKGNSNSSWTVVELIERGLIIAQFNDVWHFLGLITTMINVLHIFVNMYKTHKNEWWISLLWACL